jgi:hypothetical protein
MPDEEQPGRRVVAESDSIHLVGFGVPRVTVILRHG